MSAVGVVAVQVDNVDGSTDEEESPVQHLGLILARSSILLMVDFTGACHI